MGLAPCAHRLSPSDWGPVRRIVICDRHACCHGIGCVPGSGFSRRSVRILAGGERRRHPHVRNCGVPRFHRLTRTSASHRRHLDGDPRRQTLDYRLAASDGGIFSFDAGFYGSIPGIGLNPAGSGTPPQPQRPIVATVHSVTGQGYFLVAPDRGVFAFGDATFAGSCPGIGGCAGSAVAVVPEVTGLGYWVRTQSMPITSAAATEPTGAGYILYAARQVFAHGHATCFASLPAGATTSSDSAAAIFVTDDHLGYWNATAQGKVYPFGDAPFEGDMSGAALNGSVMAATGT